jgi:secretion/DNA translocation related TadE-like protein
MAVVWLMAAVAMAAGGVRAARHRAHTAADLAALAAASRAAAGSVPACRTAAVVAAGSDGRLAECTVHDRIADVTVVATVHGPGPIRAMRLRARARAGPVEPVRDARRP